MEIKIATAIIAGLAGVAGGLIGVVGKGYVAKQKLRELEFEYENKLQDKYLGNARDYLSSVYVPLSISLTSLNTAYQAYRSKPNIKAEDERFRKAIRTFREEVTLLGEKGANAFLTTLLDETLQSFSEFLNSSLSAEAPMIKMIAKVSLGVIPFMSGYDAGGEYKVSSKKLKHLPRQAISLNLGTINITYSADETLYAPLNTEEFEKRFTRDMFTLNGLVKEVTLGSYSSK